MPHQPGGDSRQLLTNTALKLLSIGVYVGLRLYSADDPTPTQLTEDADETLFRSTIYNQSHVLHRFLTVVNSHQYSLRSRRHNLLSTFYKN